MSPVERPPTPLTESFLGSDKASSVYRLQKASSKTSHSVYPGNRSKSLGTEPPLAKCPCFSRVKAVILRATVCGFRHHQLQNKRKQKHDQYAAIEVTPVPDLPLGCFYVARKEKHGYNSSETCFVTMLDLLSG